MATPEEQYQDHRDRNLKGSGHMINLPNSGLRLKIVLIVVAGIVVAFSVIGAFRVMHERQRISEEIRLSGQERVVLLAEALANLVIAYDYTDMESLADRVVAQQDVQALLIKNRYEKTMVARSRDGDTNMDIKPDGDTMRFQAPVLFSGKQVGTVQIWLSLNRMKRQLLDTYWDVALEQVFTGTLLGLLMYLAGSYVIVKPINKIRDSMHQIITNPDAKSPQQLHMPNRDEIGELAEIFNEMNKKVFEYQTRLQDKYTLADQALVATNTALKTRSRELEERTQELEKALALVNQIATTDSLTGLANRRMFDNALEAAVKLARRYGETLSLVLIDLDYFKQINDRFGHEAGDQVLISLGSLIHSRVRESDTAARLGGDEFALILHRSDEDSACQLAEDLLQAILSHDFVYNGHHIPVTLSIGVAQLSPEADGDTALFVAADKALYAAKGRGRNQVVASSLIS